LKSSLWISPIPLVFFFNEDRSMSTQTNGQGAAQVGVIMGSSSDWETMRHAVETLEGLGIPCETEVVSAHRTPDKLFNYAEAAEGRGIAVIIAGAGGAAHLPGMVAAKTALPVLGVPVQSKALNGMDSLLSIVQMPAGIPVGTLAIGRAGAINAALLAAAILGNQYPEHRAALKAFRDKQTATVMSNPDPRPKELPESGA
jgi:5-(carboxyamino)imidazole ribonucleotide mutase